MMQKDRNLEPVLPEKNKNYKQTNVSITVPFI